jgi:hypothetical protein
MKKKNIVVSSIVLSLVIGVSAFSYSVIAEKSKYPTDKLKYEDMIKHDKIEKENIEKGKKQKPLPADEKALSEDPGNYDEFGVFDASDMQLPLPSEEAKKYNIVTAGLAPYNGIYTGNLIEDPSQGIIINRYERVKTGELKTYYYKIPDCGTITIISLSADKKVFAFKTETGKSGTFDTTDGKGKYTIN